MRSPGPASCSTRSSCSSVCRPVRSHGSRCGSPTSSTRATLCSSPPTTAASTSPPVSTHGRWKRSRTSTPPFGGSRRLTAKPGPMRISRELYDEMVAHAIADAPDECCGIISSRDDAAVELFQMENVFHTPFRYGMDPMELYRVVTGIEDAGLDVGIIYHSH